VAQKADGLAHTKWLCKYHIVSAPKHGRKAIHGRCRKDPPGGPGQLCQWKGVEIIEGHLMPDHVHMPAGVPPKTGVSSLMGYPRGKSSLLMFDRHANLRHEFGNRKFWAEGRYVSTVGSSESTIAKHVREQESADIALDRFERQGVRGSVFQITRHGRFDRPATSQGAIGPGRSEGQGLESLAGTDRVIPLERTTRYAGDANLRAIATSKGHERQKKMP
jgi:putative transposase